jgi:hypothetical protein
MRTKQSVKQHLKLASIGFGALLAFVLGLSACSNPSGGGGNNSGNPDDTPSGFRVTFVHNVPNTAYMGGNVPPALPNVEDGYTITLPSFDPGAEDFYRRNPNHGVAPASGPNYPNYHQYYRLLGWDITPTGENWMTGRFTVTRDTNLYAIWSLPPFSYARFFRNDGSYNDIYQTMYNKPGEEITLPYGPVGFNGADGNPRHGAT